MKPPILTSISPNTEADDVKLAARVIFSPRTWSKSGHNLAVQNLLTNYLGQETITTSSGRQALTALLGAHEIGPGDEVIIQAFTCLAVPAAVSWTGAQPVYADIDPTTYNLTPASVEARITTCTRAIIVQHTFGIPGPLDDLRRLADTHHLLLIEDCAHALGATFKEKVVGTIGDSAAFSFGRDKALSSVFGGGVTSKHRSVLAALKQTQAQFPLPPRPWVAQQLLHPLLLRLVIPTYFTHSAGKALLVLFQQTHLLSKAVTPTEKSGKKPAHLHYCYSPALAQLLINQMKKLPRYLEQRQHHARHYLHNLAPLADRLQLPTPLAGSIPSWLRFPVQVKDPHAVQAAARAQRILLGDWYETPVFPPTTPPHLFGYTAGSCPHAEHVARHIINLPTYPKLTADDIERICNIIAKNA